MAKNKKPTSLRRKWAEFVFEPKRFVTIAVVIAVALLCLAAAVRPDAVAVWLQNIVFSVVLALQPFIGFLVVLGILYLGFKVMFKGVK